MKSSVFSMLDRRGHTLERGIALDLASDLSLVKGKLQLLLKNYGEPFLASILSALDKTMIETVENLELSNKSLATINQESKRIMIELSQCAMVERIKTLEELRRRIQFAREQHAEQQRIARRYKR